MVILGVHQEWAFQAKPPYLSGRLSPRGTGFIRSILEGQPLSEHKKSIYSTLDEQFGHLFPKCSMDQKVEDPLKQVTKEKWKKLVSRTHLIFAGWVDWPTSLTC